MADLFLSKREQVYNFIKSKGRARTSEVIKFGSSIFSNRADRDCRNLASENRIWRMREDIKKMVYDKTKEDVWSVYPNDR